MSVFEARNAEVLPSGDENSLFNERELETYHSTHAWNQFLLRAIANGNLPMVERFFAVNEQRGIRIGKLSDNELRQAQYIAVGLTYEVSRVAIEAGMFEADVFLEADAFIQKIDRETSPSRVLEMIYQSILGWTRAIHEIRSHQVVSPPIRACLEYIYEHLHARITREELADISGFSGPYLSALFKKEVGENIPAYILRLKVKAAQEMLLNTKRSPKDIAFIFNFSSQSYFIRCFKEITGVTPGEFRKREFGRRAGAPLAESGPHGH